MVVTKRDRARTRQAAQTLNAARAQARHMAALEDAQRKSPSEKHYDTLRHMLLVLEEAAETWGLDEPIREGGDGPLPTIRELTETVRGMTEIRRYLNGSVSD